MTCIGCGCTDDRACCEGMRNGEPIPCHWVAPGLCSLCVTISQIGYAEATNRPFYFDRLEAMGSRL